MNAYGSIFDLHKASSTTAKMITHVRALTMALSIAILALSLSSYNTHCAPIASYVSTGDNLDIAAAMIQDRQLIATLVASQASILCPRFLKMTIRETSTEETLHGHSHSEIAGQVAMPLLLAASWVFTIVFDLKSTITLSGLGKLLSANTTLGYVVYGIKHLVVLALVAESMIVCIEYFLTDKGGMVRLSRPEDGQSRT